MTSSEVSRILYDMAEAVDASGRISTPDNVVDAAKQRVGRLVEESWYDEIDRLEQLENVLCDAFSIKIFLVEKPDDISEASERTGLSTDEIAGLLNSNRGFVLQPTGSRVGRAKHVAVVDTRGSKRFSSEFTKWHEIAHVITDYFPEETEFSSFAARTAEVGDEEPKDVGEKIVDRLASELLYWDPVWDSTFEQELREYGGLTFDIIERLKGRYSSHVSFRSFAIQCVKRFHKPCLLARVEETLKPSQRRQEKQFEAQEALPGVDSGPQFEEKLRLVEPIVPDSTNIEDPLDIWAYLEVPADSPLRRAFQREVDQASAYTDQSEWQRTRRGSLDSLPLYVEAKQFGPNTLGLIQPDWNRFEHGESGELLDA